MVFTDVNVGRSASLYPSRHTLSFLNTKSGGSGSPSKAVNTHGRDNPIGLLVCDQ